MRLPVAPIAVFLSLLFRGSEGLTQTNLATIQRTLQPVIGGTNIALMARLAFHGCVGGCNGCLDITNPDNAGLQPLVAALDAVYVSKNYSTLLSRADFWAYASIMAINLGVANINSGVASSGLVFQYGRKDCTTAPYGGTQNLPSANLDYTGVMNYFAKEFGFNSSQVVALMGVHTLGSAHTNNSGFSGNWWLPTPNTFNNAYYQILSNTSMGWTQRNISPSGSTAHYQWNGLSSRPPGLMLNSDMALYKNIQVNATTGQSSCTFSSCAASPTQAAVNKYASSLSSWVTDFAAVYTAMLSHGASNLQAVLT